MNAIQRQIKLKAICSYNEADGVQKDLIELENIYDRTFKIIENLSDNVSKRTAIQNLDNLYRCITDGLK